MDPDNPQNDQQPITSDPPPTTPGEAPVQDTQPQMDAPVQPEPISPPEQPSFGTQEETQTQEPITQPDQPTEYTQPESITQEPQDQFAQGTEPISPPPSEPETQQAIPPQEQQFQVEEVQQQQEPPPQTAPPPSHQDAKPKSKINVFTIVAVFIIVILLGLVGFLFMQNNQLKNEQAQVPPSPLPTLLPTLEPTPTPTEDPTADWVVFSNDTYAFKHPPDWVVEEASGEPFGEKVSITNSTGSVAIVVATGDLPFGFGQVELETNPIIISVGGIEIQGEEVTVDGRSVHVVYDHSANEQSYKIIFGTGSPAGDDQLASLDDYNSQKDTLLEILSTFKFTE